MKTLFTIFSLILLMSITSSVMGQTDTMKTDKIYMLDGSIMKGTVETVKKLTPSIISYIKKNLT